MQSRSTQAIPPVMGIISEIKGLFAASSDTKAPDDSALSPVNPGSIPGRVTLIPGKLEVVIGKGKLEVGNVGLTPEATQEFSSNVYRTFCSSGLVNLGQKEIFLALPEIDSDTMAKLQKDVFSYYSMVYKLAAQGQFVAQGGFTVFAEQAPFDSPFSGFAYLASTPDRVGPSIPKNALLALYLLPDECSIVQVAGPYHVAAWLARGYRMFPYPNISDPFRETSVPQDLPDTLLSKLPICRGTSSTTVCLCGDELKVRVADEILKNLRDGLDVIAENKTFALTTGHASHADSRLVWMPNKDQPEAVGAEDSPLAHIELGFVIFVGEQSDTTNVLLEDGVSLLLSHDDWDKLVEFIQTGKECVITMEEPRRRDLDRVTLESYQTH